ncbi:hypothetical protein T492DRAFT_467893 [Pavlovales sp. CCMP2436]|nr:hypothetical protein T492DRAFT_467893 [Pavlovales sp. CCMP2436]
MPALLICPLFSALVVGLLLTHSSLALFNRTTFESLSANHIQYLHGRGARSPFDRGACFNVVVFCCGCARAAPVDWAGLLADADAQVDRSDAGKPEEARGAARLSLSDALGYDGALSPRGPIRHADGAGLVSRAHPRGFRVCCRPAQMELV